MLTAFKFAIVWLLIFDSVHSFADNPVFTHLVYNATFEEHFPFANEVINQEIMVRPEIMALDGNHERNDKIVYSIISGNEDGYFAMGFHDAKVFLRRQIDRERLISDYFTLIIRASLASDPVRFSIARLSVQVLDLNDNAPKFHVQFHSVSIPENSPVGYKILQVLATDPDKAENASFHYRLSDRSELDGVFDVDADTGWLSVARVLDREEIALVKIAILAVETSASFETRMSNQISHCQVHIHLADCNDNSPRFVPSNVYSFVVDELAQAGSIIGEVKAEDADALENGDVVYSIQTRTTGHNRGAAAAAGAAAELVIPFSIHPHSGHIIVVDTPLDPPKYTLFIEASDMSSIEKERKKSIAIVEIVVVPRVERMPYFLNAPYEYWISALAEVGTRVGQTTATGFYDKNVRYAFVEEVSQPVPFEIEPSTGIIRVAWCLCESKTSVYFLTVVAVHGSRNVSTSVTIHLIDLKAARKTRQHFVNYQFSVAENEANVFVGRLVYPPRARTSRRGIEFILRENDPSQDQWSVLSNGSIFTKKTLDRESVTNVTLSVVVREHSNRRIVDEVQVFIDVIDVNDNPPIFTKRVYVAHVSTNPLNEPSFNMKHAIKATDADDFPNNVTQYSLAGRASRHFQIDALTGQLSATDNNLNRATYNLTVIGRDIGNLSSTCQVIIFVSDHDSSWLKMSGIEFGTALETGVLMAGNRPVNVTYYKMLIPEGFYHQKGFISFSTGDFGGTGRASNATYSIIHNGSHQLPFIIDKTTGAMIINGAIDGGQSELYEMTVEVMEHSSDGFPASRVQLFVHVQDVNEHAPQFRNAITSSSSSGLEAKNPLAMFTSTVKHGTPSGTFVTQLLATDQDSGGRAALISYSLGSHSNQFKIDRNDGSIYTITDIDYEKGSEYNVIVIASDNGAPSLSATAILHLLIEPFNCQVVDAYLGTIDVDVLENVSVPYPLINLTMWISTRDFQLTLLQSNFTMFVLDQTEPVVWLTEPVDRERTARYLLTVKLDQFDNSTVNFCAPGLQEMTLDVNIVDVNDNQPLFDIIDQPLVIAVSSDVAVNGEIATIKARDADEGLNALIRYSMAPDAAKYNREFENRFSINAVSGKVNVKQSLVQDAGRSLHYLVKATDSNGSLNGKSALLHLTVHVVDSAHEVTLVLGRRPEELMEHSEDICDVIRNVCNVRVWVRNVDGHFDGGAIDSTMSDISLYAVNLDDDKILTSDTLMRSLHSKRDELMDKLSDFSLTDIRGFEVVKMSSIIQMHPLELTFIAMGAVVLVGSIIALVAVFLSRRNFKMKTLEQRLESAEVPGARDYRLKPVMKAHRALDESFRSAVQNTSTDDIYGQIMEGIRRRKSLENNIFPRVSSNRRRSFVIRCRNCNRIDQRHAQCHRCGKPVKKNDRMKRQGEMRASHRNPAIASRRNQLPKRCHSMTEHTNLPRTGTQC